jgi:lysozyme
VRTGEVGVELIKKYEGFSARPYLCPANVPTIGFGSTRWFDGYHITMDSRTISRDDATRLLQMELHHIESAVPQLIKAPLTQNQFDALASFTFNLGSGRLQSSTLRARVNRLDYDGAADEFPKWCKAANKVLPGLVRRRAEERQLWLTT